MVLSAKPRAGDCSRGAGVLGVHGGDDQRQVGVEATDLSTCTQGRRQGREDGIGISMTILTDQQLGEQERECWIVRLGHSRLGQDLDRPVLVARLPGGQGRTLRKHWSDEHIQLRHRLDYSRRWRPD